MWPLMESMRDDHLIETPFLGRRAAVDETDETRDMSPIGLVVNVTVILWAVTGHSLVVR